MNRLLRQRGIGKRALCLGACGVFAAAVVAVAPSVARGAEAPAPASYEVVASAEGVRVSFGAPGFVAVDTFIDGGGPLSHSVIDGLGNSQAFASLPYPGDLAISGPGLLAGLTGLPSPPSYPFYVSSSHPTVPESKLTQPGYELTATSNGSESKASTTTGGTFGGGSSASSIGSTVTSAVTSRDATSGMVTAVAMGTASIVNIGGVLRIGQVDAEAKATRGTETEPTREASFAISGMTIAGQTVGLSEKGLTFGGTDTPIPPGNPLTEALKQAKISVQFLARIDNPNGVVSPGLVITQEQPTPGGPTMVTRFVFGQMAAWATVSGSTTSIGASLPLVDTVPADTQPVRLAFDTPAAPATTTERVPPPTGIDGSSGSDGSSGVVDSGLSATTEATSELAAPVTDQALAAEPTAQEAAPVLSAPMTLVDTGSIYLILVAAAAVALAGGTVLRLVGVKLKWTS